VQQLSVNALSAIWRGSYKGPACCAAYIRLRHDGTWIVIAMRSLYTAHR